MGYLINALFMFILLSSLDRILGKEYFLTNIDKMRRVGLSFIWPITLIILIVMMIKLRNK